MTNKLEHSRFVKREVDCPQKFFDVWYQTILKYPQTNLEGGMNMLSLFLESGIDIFVFADFEITDEQRGRVYNTMNITHNVHNVRAKSYLNRMSEIFRDFKIETENLLFIGLKLLSTNNPPDLSLFSRSDQLSEIKLLILENESNYKLFIKIINFVCGKINSKEENILSLIRRRNEIIHGNANLAWSILQQLRKLIYKEVYQEFDEELKRRFPTQDDWDKFSKNLFRYD